MLKKKYIFWDFNGTILDDVKLCHNILNEMLTEVNRKTVTLEEYLKIFDFPVKNYYAKVYDLEKTPFEELSKTFISKYQPRSFDESLHDGVLDAMFYFQSLGVKNILLSASEQNNLNEQVKHFGIGHYFEAVLGTDNVHGESKIDVAKTYVKKHKINPKDVVMIGDTLHDAEVAETLGFDVILYTKGHQHRDRLKAYQKINHFFELSRIIIKK